VNTHPPVKPRSTIDQHCGAGEAAFAQSRERFIRIR
jgi:hypothetical protein